MRRHDTQSTVRGWEWVLLLAVFSLALPASGQNARESEAPGPSEYDVKAAFLLNFARFVEWPVPPRARRAEPFSICILGDDPFGGSLARIVADEAIGGRPVVVKRVRTWPDSCEVLFIPASWPSQAAVLAQVGPDVLTVGEEEDFLRDGGMIQFILENRRVRFDINRQTAERSHLKMSSRLLGVARRVLK